MVVEVAYSAGQEAEWTELGVIDVNGLAGRGNVEDADDIFDKAVFKKYADGRVEDKGIGDPVQLGESISFTEYLILRVSVNLFCKSTNALFVPRIIGNDNVKYWNLFDNVNDIADVVGDINDKSSAGGGGGRKQESKRKEESECQDRDFFSKRGHVVIQ